MKCKEVTDFLEQALRLSKSDTSLELVALRQILASHADKTVQVLVSSVMNLDVNTETAYNSSKNESETFRSYRQFADRFAKPALQKDIAALNDALTKFSDQELSEIANLLKERTYKLTKSKKSKEKIDPALVLEAVNRHCRRLEEALGDDVGFQSVVADIERDQLIRVKELKQIAKNFAGSAGKDRAGALSKISSRHDALMSSRAKSAATAGRVAG